MRDVFASPAQFVNPAINRLKVARRTFPSSGQKLYPEHYFNTAKEFNAAFWSASDPSGPVARQA
jgi:hypothetical protein